MNKLKRGDRVYFLKAEDPTVPLDHTRFQVVAGIYVGNKQKGFYTEDIVFKTVVLGDDDLETSVIQLGTGLFQSRSDAEEKAQELHERTFATALKRLNAIDCQPKKASK